MLNAVFKATGLEMYVTPQENGGQRGNRTPDTRIFNGVSQNYPFIFSTLNLKHPSVLQSVLHHLIFFH